MTKFLVILEVVNGDCEKLSHRIVSADTDNDAADLALIAECHSEQGEGAEMLEDGMSDMDGQYMYSIHSVKEIDEKDISVLEKYLIN
jgi:hypothetical protein